MSSIKFYYDTLVIINPKAADGSTETNLDLFSSLLKKTDVRKIKIIITKKSSDAKIY